MEIAWYKVEHIFLNKTWSFEEFLVVFIVPTFVGFPVFFKLKYFKTSKFGHFYKYYNSDDIMNCSV